MTQKSNASENEVTYDVMKKKKKINPNAIEISNKKKFIYSRSERMNTKKKKRLLRIWTLTFMHTNTAGRFKIKRNKKKKGTGYIWKLVFKAVEYLHIHFVIAKDKRKVKHCRRAFCCWSKNACSFAVCVSHILRSLQWLILLQWDWPIECSNVILCAVDMKREKNELKLKKKKMLAIKGKKVNKEKWKKNSFVSTERYSHWEFVSSGLKSNDKKGN